MAAESDHIHKMRKRFLTLLEEGEFLLERHVENEGRRTLGLYRKCDSQFALIDFVADLLKANYPISTMDLNDERYKPGTGYVMNRPYEWDVYIKLTITCSISRPKVHIMSFHPNR